MAEYDNKNSSQSVERALNILETNQKITLDAGNKIASLIDNLKDFAKNYGNDLIYEL